MELTTRGSVTLQQYENTMVLGLDPSLNSTGLCVMRGDSLVRCARVTHKLTGILRLKYIRDAVKDIICSYDIDVCGMEGYVYGRSMMVTNSFELHELGGILKLMMHENDTPYHVFAPTSLKKFATGNARKVKKEDMIAGIAATWNIHFSKKQNDMADAYTLAKVCYFSHVALAERDTPTSMLFSGLLKSYQLDTINGIKARTIERE